MFRKLVLICAIVLMGVFNSVGSESLAVAEPPLITSFKQLIEEVDLSYKPPVGFEEINAQANPVFQYEHAIRHQAKNLEVRYAVRPIGRIKIDYEDPHSSAPAPDHLFPLMFNSIADTLSAGGHSPRKEYPTAQAHELFNADWAAASVFDVKPEFSDSYSQGLLIAMHKSGKADAYVIYLYDDFEQIKDLLNTSLSALSFSP